jgi:2-C-methyl-D-erythritol 4-phosphate cytidylyltransferase
MGKCTRLSPCFCLSRRAPLLQRPSHHLHWVPHRFSVGGAIVSRKVPGNFPANRAPTPEGVGHPAGTLRKPMPQFVAIIPAAGASTRYAGPRNKLLEKIHLETVIARTVKAFLSRSDVSQIILPTTLKELPTILPAEPRLHFCEGGNCRAQSVYNGLKALPENIEWVAIHDGARPLISQDLINRTLAAAIEHGAAVPALPVTLTIKQAAGPLPAKVEKTIAREKLWAMQTPQIMQRAALQKAFKTCPIPLSEVTDDVQLLELAGQEVWLIPGEEQNLKITTAMDLKLAELFLPLRQSPNPE